MAVQQRSEETRQRILLAAQTSFAEQGYQSASVSEICELAGVSKGAFYHHFPTKQAIFLALLDHWLDGIDARLATYGEEANTPEAFERMADVVGDVFRDGKGQLPLFLEFWAQAAHDPVIWEATTTHYRRYRTFFAQMIEAGIAGGTLRPTDAEAAAQALVSFAVGIILQGLLDPQGEDWGQTARAGVRLWLCALRQEKDQGVI